MYYISYCVILLTLIPVLSNGQNNEGQNVLELSKIKFDWFIEKRFDSLKYLLDDELVYIHSNGWIQSRDEVLNDIQSGKLLYKEVKVVYAHVRIFSNTALVIGRGKFSGTMDGNYFEVNLLYTEVYIIKNKMWKLVSRHANSIPMG